MVLAVGLFPDPGGCFVPSCRLVPAVYDACDAVHDLAVHFVARLAEVIEACKAGIICHRFGVEYALSLKVVDIIDETLVVVGVYVVETAICRRKFPAFAACAVP